MLAKLSWKRALKAAVLAFASLVLLLLMVASASAHVGAVTVPANPQVALAVPAPLSVTYTKVLCPRYTDVPGNTNPDSLDATGGHWQEQDPSFAKITTDPATQIPANCHRAADGWKVQFRNANNTGDGALLSTSTTDKTGAVTVSLTDTQIDLARTGGGLWVNEVIGSGGTASFGAMRCYNDHLNGDNMENIQGVPDSVPSVNCIAYNVAGPGISLTKTVSPTTPYVVGDTLTYTYRVINTSNVDTGSRTFAITDNKINDGAPFDCNTTTQDLAPDVYVGTGTGTLANPSPGSFVECTRTHPVSQQDVNDNLITNLATASYQYTSGSSTVTVSSNQASATVYAKPVLTLTANDASRVYGAGDPTFTWTLSDTSVTLTTPPTCTSTDTPTSPVSGPTFPITCSGAAATGYAITYKKGTLTIGQAPLVITASSDTMTYGGTVPTITATFASFVNGDDYHALGAAFSCGTTAMSSSPVGSYDTSCTGAVDANYSITYKKGTLTIGGIPLTLTANDASRVYGAGEPTFTWTLSDTSVTLTTPPTCTSTDTPTSPVSGLTFPITCSDATASGYAITYLPGTLTITPAPLTITASSATMSYGGTVPTITPIYDGLLNGNTAPVNPPTCGTSATSTSPINTSYPSSCDGASDPNYTIKYVAGLVTVTDKHILVVTADNQTRVQGQDNPPLTYTITGWVGSDGPSSLSTQPICTTTATAATAAGTYAITCSGAASDNYAFTYVAGTLTITPLATPKPTIIVGGATGTPRTPTPPPTNTGDGSSNGGPTPLFPVVICLLFAGIGLLGVQSQLRSMRR
jgi:hypothetical protein